MTCVPCKDFDLRQYRHPWTVEKLTGTAADGGHVDESDDSNWSALGRFKFKVHSENSREFFRALQVQSDITHLFEVPYSATTNKITTNMRLRKGDRKLNIKGAYNVDEANQVIRLRLVERV